ncbi:MAG TPA: lipid-A-disaccharide synthase, partial [Vicinamibacterales bacterium]
RLGVPVVYYISPQLWAWRPGRMKTMRRIADRVLVIFPFEEEIYRRADVPVEWVGHPLLDVSSEPRPRAEFLESLGLDPGRPLVAILPGSRINEVRAILPRLLDAATIIHGRLPAAQFVLARAPHLGDELFSELARGGPAITMVANATDDVLAAADVGLLASGTVTVQAALRECPMIVVYRLSPLTYRLGRRFVHVNTFAMANLVAGRTVVPELEQDEFTPEAVAREALALLENPERAATMRRELREVRAKLGEPGASRRAAEAVLAVARAGRAQRLG